MDYECLLHCFKVNALGPLRKERPSPHEAGARDALDGRHNDRVWAMHNQNDMALEMIRVRSSSPELPTMPGARSRTRRWGRVPLTSSGMSLSLYLCARAFARVDQDK